MIESKIQLQIIAKEIEDINSISDMNELCAHAVRILKDLYGERERFESQIEKMKSKLERHKTIHRVGITLAEVPTLKTAMQQVVDIVATGLGYSRTAVLIRDEKLDELEMISAFGYGETEGLRIPISTGVTGYVVSHGEPVNIPDVTSDPRYVTGIRQGRSELAVPIMQGDKVKGVIDVESKVMNAFDSEDIHLLEIVASYASAAISASEQRESLDFEKNKRKQIAVKAELPAKAEKQLTSLCEIDDIFKSTLRLADDVLGFKNGIIWVVSSASGELKAEYVQGKTEIEQGCRRSISKGLPGLAIKTEKPAIGDPLTPPMGVGNRSIKRPEMAVLLKSSSEILGVLHIVREKKPFSPSELDFLIELGNQATCAITQLVQKKSAERQIQQLDDRTRRLDLLNRVARSLTTRMDLEELLNELLHLCAEAFDLSHVAVLLLDTNKKNLILRASIGYNESAPRLIPIGEGITGHVAVSGVPAVQSDVTNDPRHIVGVTGGRSEMAVPLRVFGEVIGVLDAESMEVGAFDESDLDLFMSFAAQAAIAIHNADLTAMIDKVKDR